MATYTNATLHADASSGRALTLVPADILNLRVATFTFQEAAGGGAKLTWDGTNQLEFEDSIKAVFGTGKDWKVFTNEGDADAFVIQDVTNSRDFLNLKTTQITIGNTTDDLPVSIYGVTTHNDDVTINGDLDVNGTLTTIDTQSLEVEDPLIKLARSNVADISDIGLYGQYDDGTTRYTGFFRDADDGDTPKKWKLFYHLTVDPLSSVGGGDIDTGDASYERGDLEVGMLEAYKAVSGTPGWAIRAITEITSDNQYGVYADTTSVGLDAAEVGGGFYATLDGNAGDAATSEIRAYTAIAEDSEGDADRYAYYLDSTNMDGSLVSSGQMDILTLADNGDINLVPHGEGVVNIDNATAFNLPQDDSADTTEGNLRYNDGAKTVEYRTDAAWLTLGTTIGTGLQTAYDNDNTVQLSDAVGDWEITIDDGGSVGGPGAANWVIQGFASENYLSTDGANTKAVLGDGTNGITVEAHGFLDALAGVDITKTLAGADASLSVTSVAGLTNGQTVEQISFTAGVLDNGHAAAGLTLTGVVNNLTAAGSTFTGIDVALTEPTDADATVYGIQVADLVLGGNGTYQHMLLGGAGKLQGGTGLTLSTGASDGDISLDPHGTGDVDILSGNLLFTGNGDIGVVGQGTSPINVYAATSVVVGTSVTITTDTVSGNAGLTVNNTSNVGSHLVIDNQDTTGKVYVRTGTDTSATAFEIQSNTTGTFFTAAGDHSITIDSPNDDANAFLIQEDGNQILNVDTTGTNDTITLGSNSKYVYTTIYGRSYGGSGLQLSCDSDEANFSSLYASFGGSRDAALGAGKDITGLLVAINGFAADDNTAEIEGIRFSTSTAGDATKSALVMDSGWTNLIHASMVSGGIMDIRVGDNASNFMFAFPDNDPSVPTDPILTSDASGNTTWVAAGSHSSLTLQQAYEHGNTIALDAVNGDLAITIGDVLSVGGDFANFSVKGDGGEGFIVTDADDGFLVLGDGANSIDVHIDDAYLLWTTDGGGNVGAPGANRPDHVYAKTDVVIGDSVTITTNAVTSSVALTIATGANNHINLSPNGTGDTDLTNGGLLFSGAGDIGALGANRPVNAYLDTSLEVGDNALERAVLTQDTLALYDATDTAVFQIADSGIALPGVVITTGGASGVERALFLAASDGAVEKPGAVAWFQSGAGGASDAADDGGDGGTLAIASGEGGAAKTGVGAGGRGGAISVVAGAGGAGAVGKAPDDGGGITLMAGAGGTFVDTGSADGGSVLIYGGSGIPGGGVDGAIICNTDIVFTSDSVANIGTRDDGANWRRPRGVYVGVETVIGTTSGTLNITDDTLEFDSAGSADAPAIWKVTQTTTKGWDGGISQFSSGQGGVSDETTDGGSGGALTITGGLGADGTVGGSIGAGGDAGDGGNVVVTAGAAGVENNGAGTGGDGGQILMVAGNTTDTTVSGAFFPTTIIQPSANGSYGDLGFSKANPIIGPTAAAGDSSITLQATGGKGVVLGSTASTLKCFNITTVQKAALTISDGMVVYDSDLNLFQFRENGVWVNLAEADLTLQQAYENGNTITLDGPQQGDLTFTIDEAGSVGGDEGDFIVTGTTGDYLQTDGANTRLLLGSASVDAYMNGNDLLWTVDGNGNIGTAGDYRPDKIWAVTEIKAGAGVTINGPNHRVSFGSNDGQILIQDDSDTTFKIATATRDFMVFDSVTGVGSVGGDDGNIKITFDSILESRFGLTQSSRHEDTLVAGSTASTAKLAATASTKNDFYNGMQIVMSSGGAAGHIRTIIDYVGATKIATISPDWAPTPGADSYSVYGESLFTGSADLEFGATVRTFGLAVRTGLGGGGIALYDNTDIAWASGEEGKVQNAIEINCNATGKFTIGDGEITWNAGDGELTLGAAAPDNVPVRLNGGTGQNYGGAAAETGTAQGVDAGSESTTIQLANGATATDNFYNGTKILLVDGTGTGQTRSIDSYVGATRMATVDTAWDQESDTAQAGGAATITLAYNASQVDSYYNGFFIEITGGTGSGQTKTITGYVGSTRIATVGVAWAPQPDNTSDYTITSVPASDTDYQLLFGGFSVPGVFVPERIEGALLFLEDGAGDIGASPSSTTIPSGRPNFVHVKDSVQLGTDGASPMSVGNGAVVFDTDARIIPGSSESLFLGKSDARSDTVPDNTSTSTTIKFDAGASDVNDFYIYQLVRITEGLGVGQQRLITGYVGATRVATISPGGSPWEIIPDNTSHFSVEKSYIVLDSSGGGGPARQGPIYFSGNLWGAGDAKFSGDGIYEGNLTVEGGSYLRVANAVSAEAKAELEGVAGGETERTTLKTDATASRVTLAAERDTGGGLQSKKTELTIGGSQTTVDTGSVIRITGGDGAASRSMRVARVDVKELRIEAGDDGHAVILGRVPSGANKGSYPAMEKYTTAERDNLDTPNVLDGGLIYNDTTKALEARVDGSWKALTTGAGSLSMQGAYEGGNTVTLDGIAEGDLTFTIDEAGSLGANEGDFIVTGTTGDYLQTDGANTRLLLGSASVDAYMNGNDLLWTADGGGDIGASGANRPDHVYVKTDVVIGDSVTINTNSIASSVALTISTAAAQTLALAPGAGGVTDIAVTGTTGAINVGTDGARIITIGSNTNGHTTALNLYSDGTLTASSKDTTTFEMVADDAGAKVLTVSAANGGAGDGDIAVTADGSIDLTTGTELDMTIGGSSSWTINAADADSVVIDDGVSTYLTFDTSTALPQVELGEFLELAAGEGGGEQMEEQEVAGTEELAVGDVVIARWDATSVETRLWKSNATSGQGTKQHVSGVVVNVNSGVDPDMAQVNTVHGSRVAVKFNAAPEAISNGDVVFLSLTAGEGTLTPPSATGQAVWALGILVGANGADTTPDVIWNPQFRYQNA